MFYIDSLHLQYLRMYLLIQCHFLYTGCRHLYDFTIASCNYAFCNCWRTKRRSYLRIDEADIPNNDRPDVSILLVIAYFVL